MNGGVVVEARLGGAVLAVAGASALVAGAAAGGAPVPNPCKLLPGSTIAAAVGLKGTALSGKLSKRPDGATKQTLCTFTHGAAKLQIYVAPHQASGGSGGPPGMVVTKPAGLGAGATFAYDVNPKFAFANVFFTKHGLDAGVWDNGKFPKGKILSLGRKVYAALS
jgi:hypothetical protein